MIPPGCKTSQDRGPWTSASNAQADSLCQWRHTMQRGIPEPARSAEADFGIRVHAALAKDDPAGLTIEERDIYDASVKIREAKLKAFFAQTNGQAIPFTEVRYWTELGNSAKNPVYHSGQADRIYRASSRLFIIDYKTGPGDQPESSRNEQLRDLAVLGWEQFIGVTEVGVCVIQPLATHDPEICLYSTTDLMKAGADMQARVLLSNAPTGEPTPGPVQCKFCRAKSKCAQYQQWAGGSLPVPSSLVDVPCQSWSPEQRAQFADHYDIAAKWLDSCWAFLETGAATDPAFVPGYELKPGAKREKITDAQQVFNRFCQLLKGSPEAFLRCVSVTKTALKTEIAALTQFKGKKLDDAVKELTAGCVEVSETKPSLKKIKP